MDLCVSLVKEEYAIRLDVVQEKHPEFVPIAESEVGRAVSFEDPRDGVRC